MPFISSIKGTGTIFSQEFLALACLFRVWIVSAPFPKISLLMARCQRNGIGAISRQVTYADLRAVHTVDAKLIGVPPEKPFGEAKLGLATPAVVDSRQNNK